MIGTPESGDRASESNRRRFLAIDWASISGYSPSARVAARPLKDSVFSSLCRPCFQLISALAGVCLLTSTVFAASPGFVPQERVGYSGGDQWEPAIAADGNSHVYVLY